MWIVLGIGTILIGVVAFFLKRNISRSDQTEKDVRRLEETKATKEEVEKLSGCINKVKEDYITKEDFYRVQANNDRKLDRIIDILLERKSQNDG